MLEPPLKQKKQQQQKTILLLRKFKFSNICKPEEGWFGQPKYCYKKQYTLFQISFAVVFGLLVFVSLYFG